MRCESSTKLCMELFKVRKTLRKSYLCVDIAWYGHGKQMSIFYMHKRTHCTVCKLQRSKIFPQQVPHTFSCSVQKTRGSNQPFLPRRTLGGIWPSYTQHSIRFISSPLWQSLIPMHCYSGLLHNLFVPLQASPSASKNLDLITNVFSTHWWNIHLKLSCFPSGNFQLNKHIIIISFNYSSLFTWS